MILTEEHRRVIAAAIPPGIDVPEEFWRDLEADIDFFNRLQQHHVDRPPAHEWKRWQRVEKLANELDHELRALKGDEMWPDRVLQACWELKAYAETRRTGYKTLAPLFRGRRNMYQASLYSSICDLWTRRLGQELRYSRTQTGMPSGPLIWFFQACSKAVLGANAPTAHAIASIIDSERLRRKRMIEVDKQLMIEVEKRYHKRHYRVSARPK